MVLVRPDSVSRRAGSAATSTALSWLIVWVRALTAEALASLNTPQHLHRPVTGLGAATARPLRTTRAAAWASRVSVLPRRRRVALSGALTSITLTPAACKCRASAAP